MSNYVHKVLDIVYHRNGVSGDGFHVVRFTSAEGEGEFVAILFEQEKSCAVLNVPQIVAGNIGFAMGNSWRGDNFEPELREAIAEWQTHSDERLQTMMERIVSTGRLQ